MNPGPRQTNPANAALARSNSSKSAPAMTSRLGSTFALTLLLALAGCATTPPPNAPARPVAASQPPAPIQPQIAYGWSPRLDTLKSGLETTTYGSGVKLERTSDQRLKVLIPGALSFAVGRSAVPLKMAPILDQIATALSGDPAVTLQIVCHTDSEGDPADNDRLSLARAVATRQHFTAHGLAQRAISVEGRGEREPLAENDDVRGRARNRRVEIWIGEAQGQS